MHDHDGVAGLLLLGDLRDPTREGKNAVASNSPDESGRRDASDGQVEQQAQDADDVHEYVSAAAKGHIVDDEEGLRGSRLVQAVQNVQVRKAEEEEDDQWETDEGRSQSRPEDAASSCDTGVLSLLGNVPRGLEANQDTCCDIVRQHPVPDGRSACFVVRLGEHVLRGLEAICLGHSDGQPDEVEHEVEQDQVGRDAEDPAIDLGVAVVHANSEEENDFGDYPLHCAELYVVDIRSEGKPENANLGENEVGGGLTQTGDESCPRCCSPPCDKETEQPAVLCATSFCGPEVDGASCWQCGTDLSENGCSDHDKNASHDIARPVAVSMRGCVGFTDMMRPTSMPLDLQLRHQ